jgi:hypothetical protein
VNAATDWTHKNLALEIGDALRECLDFDTFRINVECPSLLALRPLVGQVTSRVNAFDSLQIPVEQIAPTVTEISSEIET